MHIGDAVMIDDAQQFGFIDAVYCLRLLVVINQDNSFWAMVKHIGARAKACELAIITHHPQRAAPAQGLIPFLPRVSRVTAIKLPFPDLFSPCASLLYPSP